MADHATDRRTAIAEVAPGIHRLSSYHEPWRSSINGYLLTGTEPTLISTGMRSHFDDTWNAIARVLDRVEASAPTLLAPGHGSVLAGNLAPYYRAYRQSVSALAALRPLAEGTRPRRSVDDDASPRAPSLNRERD